MKLCIFDLDGTLINSLEDLGETVNQILAEEGLLPHTMEAYRYFVGDGVFLLLQRAFPENRRDKETLDRAKERFDLLYAENCFHHTAPYPGILKLLETLKERGKKIAVLSNKPDDFARKMVHHFFPADLFDVILGQTPGIEKKPSPEGVDRIRATLGVNREETVLIGDSNVDVFTAKNAGISSVGVTYGFRGREELAAAGADFLADSAEACGQILLNCK